MKVIRNLLTVFGSCLEFQIDSLLHVEMAQFASGIQMIIQLSQDVSHNLMLELPKGKTLFHQAALFSPTKLFFLDGLMA